MDITQFLNRGDDPAAMQFKASYNPSTSIQSARGGKDFLDSEIMRNSKRSIGDLFEADEQHMGSKLHKPNESLEVPLKIVDEKFEKAKK